MRVIIYLILGFGLIFGNLPLKAGDSKEVLKKYKEVLEKFNEGLDKEKGEVHYKIKMNLYGSPIDIRYGLDDKAIPYLIITSGAGYGTPFLFFKDDTLHYYNVALNEITKVNNCIVRLTLSINLKIDKVHMKIDVLPKAGKIIGGNCLLKLPIILSDYEDLVAQIQSKSKQRFTFVFKNKFLNSELTTSKTYTFEKYIISNYFIHELVCKKDLVDETLSQGLKEISFFFKNFNEASKIKLKVKDCETNEDMKYFTNNLNRLLYGIPYFHDNIERGAYKRFFLSNKTKKEKEEIRYLKHYFEAYHRSFLMFYLKRKVQSLRNEEKKDDKQDPSKTGTPKKKLEE